MNPWQGWAGLGWDQIPCGRVCRCTDRARFFSLPAQIFLGVSDALLDAAIGGTSSNTNSVGTIDTPFANDPATQADMEFMRAKFNELVLAGRR